jgi:hypothetical protein
VWPFPKSRKTKRLEALLSQKTDALAQQLADLRPLVATLVAHDAQQTQQVASLSFTAAILTDRVSELEARIAAVPVPAATDADLDAITAQVGEIASLLAPTPVAPVEPTPAPAS